MKIRIKLPNVDLLDILLVILAALFIVLIGAMMLHGQSSDKGPKLAPTRTSRLEPVDVPAIEVFTAEEIQVRCQKLGACSQVWTCADKARILLTAEDGTRHCIKF